MTPATPPATVLLDLDGTLLDTAPDLAGSLNDLRREEGLMPLAVGRLASVVAHGSGPMIRRGFDLEPTNERFEPLRERFLAIYRKRLSELTRPYAGMLELLDLLDASGTTWGVVTNKPGWLAAPLLAALGLGARSACLVAGDDLARRKPDPFPIREACRQLAVEPADCVVVGDAQRDIEAGRRAGALTLAALFGYINAEDRVASWGAHGLIEHPLDILRWIAYPAAAANDVMVE